MNFMGYLLEVLFQVVEPDLLLVELVDLSASCTEIREKLAMLPDKMLDGCHRRSAGEEFSLENRGGRDFEGLSHNAGDVKSGLERDFPDRTVT